MKNKIFALIFACLTFFTIPVLAEEKIDSFDSLIQVQTDGSMVVTETITVHHEGINIRRGIYRDLPTKKGEKYELIGVTRNGRYEPSFVERRSGYYRINTGDDNYLPHPGTSTFEVKYKVWNLPKSFDGYDEVYWNVTGDEWGFPIERVSAKMELPYGADIIQQASYIGNKGSKESATYEGNGQYSGRYLSPGEQLTIAVGFTPGIVSTKKYISKEDMFKNVTSLVLYFVYLGFLIWIWHKKGRDPAGRAIMPQYEPPEELTAAQAACLYNKGTTKNLAPISLLQMVTNGFLKLTTKTKETAMFFSHTTYILEKKGKQPSNVEEKCFKANTIKLDGQYHSTVKNLVYRIESKVKDTMKPFYAQNRIWVLLPTIMYSLVLIFLFLGFKLDSKDIPIALILGSGMILFFFLIVSSVLRLIREVLWRFSFRNLITLIAAMLFFWPFGRSLYNVRYKLYSYVFDSGMYGILLFPCVLITYFVFAFLLYQPTEKGQRLIEHLEGLKMFLKATKIPVKEKLKLEEKLNEKKMEKLFPYAMALGLEKEWEKRFKWHFGTSSYEDFVSHHPHMSNAFCSSFSSNLYRSSVSHSSGGSGGFSGSGSGGGGCSGGGGGGGGGGGR